MGIIVHQAVLFKPNFRSNRVCLSPTLVKGCPAHTRWPTPLIYWVRTRKKECFMPLSYTGLS